MSKCLSVLCKAFAVELTCFFKGASQINLSCLKKLNSDLQRLKLQPGG